MGTKAARTRWTRFFSEDHRTSSKGETNQATHQHFCSAPQATPRRKAGTSTNSDDLILDDVAILLDDMLDIAHASGGLKRDERQGAWYFSLVPAIYDGAARGARDWLIEFTTSRAPASLGAPLSTVPRIQDGLGQIEVWLTTNRRLLRSIAEDYDSGRPFGPDAAAVKHVVIENASRCAFRQGACAAEQPDPYDSPKAALGRHVSAAPAPIEPVPVRPPHKPPLLAVVGRNEWRPQ